MIHYSERKKIYKFFIFFTFFIILFRLFYIQIIQAKYKELATVNTLRYITEYPSRGLIFDRNENPIAINEVAYSVMVTPKYLQAFDTIQFCEIVDINIENYRNILHKAYQYSIHKPSPIINYLTPEQFTRLQEKINLFPGHSIEVRSIRRYIRPIAPHSLGYMGEVGHEDLKKDKYYTMGDLIGISGIEKKYEHILRGQKGYRIIHVDVHNKEVCSYQNGKFDKKPEPGNNLYLSIDINLQEYAEKLMQNKRGAIVAIEPATGEILTIVSSPSFDPNMLVGRERTENFKKLFADKKNHPLYNRAIMTRYPPGSTFKIVSGIAAMAELIINENTTFSCNGGYNMGNHTIKCHPHPSPLNLRNAIAHSCNTYFCWAFKYFVDNKKFETSKHGYKKWKEYVNELGFGVQLGTDFFNEFAGFVACSDYYDVLYNKKWRANNIISIAIGQGEIGSTPLQLANLAVIIANRGWYIPPHIVRSIEHIEKPNYYYKNKKINTSIPDSIFEVFAEGMLKAVREGTAKIAQIPGIDVCGKTGTAQDPPRKSHSVFIAFAPFKNPKIAIAVLVENSGWGSQWAAPIASLIIEKYLTGTVKRNDLENYIIQANLLKCK